MFKRNEEVFKIKASEFNKMKQEFTDLVHANEMLRAQLARKNFDNLIEEINTLSKALTILKKANNDLETENKSLLKTITQERAVTSLVLKKLQEVTDIYEHSFYKDRTSFKTLIDLKC